MPLWIHKVLPCLLMPTGLCIALVVASIWLKRRWLAFAGLTVLWLGATQPVSDWLLRGLEDTYPPVPVSDCPAADAVVVLGGVLRDESPAGEPEWNEAVDRFERGVALMQAGKARYLLFTAAVWPGLPETEGAMLSRQALARGIPAERILLTTTKVQNTAGESAAIRATVDTHGWRNIILVTSAFHMRRSMLLMQQAGIRAYPFPADYAARRRAIHYVQDFFPQAESAMRTERALREYCGLAYYRLKALLPRSGPRIRR